MDITKRYTDVVNKTGERWLVRSTPRQVANSTTDLLTNKFAETPSTTQGASTLDELNEIFSSHSNPAPAPALAPAPAPAPFDVTDVLKPITVHSNIPTQSGKGYSILIRLLMKRFFYVCRIS